MTITEKFLVLSVLVKVMVTFVVSYLVDHLTSAVVNCLAIIVPVLCVWN